MDGKTITVMMIMISVMIPKSVMTRIIIIVSYC